MIDTKKVREILLFVGLSLIILIILFLFKNHKTNQLEESDLIESIESGVDLKIKNFHLMEEKRGYKEWELDARSAEIIHSQNVTNLEGVKMTFFSVDNGPFYLVADEGIIYNNTRDVEIYGDISISSKDGYLLNTNSLKWISAESEIKTDDFVEITGPNFRITGEGLISDIDIEDVEIKNRVKATFYGGLF